jgi:V-type H+-transporting ATPase 16kDa proteolipid subunit
LIVGVVVLGTIIPPSEGEYPAWRGYVHFGAGLSTGLSGLAAGVSLGVIGEYGIRAYGQQSRLFAPMVLCLIFSEALAIYGTIIGLVCATKVT